MSDATIVSFQEAVEARRAEDLSAQRVTDESLRDGQTTIAFDTCHAAFDRVSLQHKFKTRRITLFNDLSAGFPKNRHLAILSHKGAGKDALVELLLGERRPTRGRVLVNSRLSWPIHHVQFLDQRLTLRQNAVFVARVLGVVPTRLLSVMHGFCDLTAKQLDEPLRMLPPPLRRRLGIVIALAADFDCLVMDNAFNAEFFGLHDEAKHQVERLMLERDYIMCVEKSKHVPANCDLLYLMYEGRLYAFDDIDKGRYLFDQLPVPRPIGMERPGRADEDDDDDVREEF